VTNCVLGQGVRSDEEETVAGVKVVIDECHVRRPRTRRGCDKFAEGRAASGLHSSLTCLCELARYSEKEGVVGRGGGRRTVGAVRCFVQLARYPYITTLGHGILSLSALCSI
jgi:hypothetical protein